MASRYPETRVIDYCYHPIHVVDEDKDIIVPCGKCDGCLLHKANEWSMRCGMEIEDSPATIFGTLTYSNKYLPKLFPISSEPYLSVLGNEDFFGNPESFPCDLQMVSEQVWISDHSMNVRFNGVRDVLRHDNIIISTHYNKYFSIPVVNWDNKKFPCINYASKRDIQLWLKLLRKSLSDYGIYKNERNVSSGYFRYFIIAEVGPTSHRNHFHFLIFCKSQEIASYLLECSLYQNWQMCDEDRFAPYCHLCDSGARGYVTQYLTSTSDLPKVYREVKEIRPFRLASKSPAIGFIGQDKKKIFQDVDKGVIQYSRKIYRLESTSLLEYPASFLATLFPKCYRFNKIDSQRRFLIYNYLYRAVRKYGYSYSILSRRLSTCLNASDFLATSACYRFCKEYVASPDYYYYLLDTYYYKKDMLHLKSFYESQMECDFHENPYKIFEFYPNIEQLCCDEYKSEESLLALHNILYPLGFDLVGLLDNKSFFLSVRKLIEYYNRDYRREVMDIKTNMIKMSQFNEAIGIAPTNV